MRQTRKVATGRRGAIAPFAALLMTVLVGMLAFSIDTGYMVAVRSELQNAADAAALSAAQQLQQPFVQFALANKLANAGVAGQSQIAANIYNAATADTTTPTSPICTAQNVASKNFAGGVTVNVPGADISFWYWDGTSPSFQAPNNASPSTAVFPNTVTVVTRRDATANGPVSLFFGQIFGMSAVELTATASATIFAGDVGSLQVVGNNVSGSTPIIGAHILPVAFDVNYWIKYTKTGVSPDGNVYLGPNGMPQVQVYPYPGNAPGSFGLLDVGVPSNNVPAFRSWINNGQTPNDINYLVSNNLVPVSMTAPKQWKCGPGLKSTLVTNFQSVEGVPNLLPLFIPVDRGFTSAYMLNAVSTGTYQAATGQGQGATYAICGFVGVDVTQATGNGSNLIISVQPMSIVDPTAVMTAGSTIPASLGQATQFGNYLPTTFVSAKLTR